jgi:hypothetical protein
MRRDRPGLALPRHEVRTALQEQGQDALATWKKNNQGRGLDCQTAHEFTVYHLSFTIETECRLCYSTWQS